jgi:hypothetical protein
MTKNVLLTQKSENRRLLLITRANTKNGDALKATPFYFWI